jgi:hypothetical protein
MLARARPLAYSSAMSNRPVIDARTGTSSCAWWAVALLVLACSSNTTQDDSSTAAGSAGADAASEAEPRGGSGGASATDVSGGTDSGGGSETGGSGEVGGGTGASGGTHGDGGSPTGGSDGKGGSATGGTDSGGGSPTGGSDGDGGSVAGGSGGTGGVATGGSDGTGGYPGVPTIEEIPIVEGIGQCEPPCGITLENNDAYVGGAEGASLLFDFEAGEVTLRNDPENATATQQTVMMFTWEPGDYGFGIWTTGPFWFVFTENYEYDYGYSVWTDVQMRSQLTNPDTGDTVIVIYSFDAEHAVRIHEARVPRCDPNGSGPCQNPDDCPHVESGATELLSSACSACYERIVACSAANCADTCPGQGGNACMMCETDAGCHTEFMQCSGLDYMPPATLTLPG